MLPADITKIASAIEHHIGAILATYPDLPVTQAMVHATQGGKRLRGYLVCTSAALYDCAIDQSLEPATAIELMHAYSLVHDDLPAMDDDDLRRGQPTCHVKWDEATAILAGDALQSLAFERLALPDWHADATIRSDLIMRLAQAAGARGMVLGQAQDIMAETAAQPLSIARITALQRRKTGALLEWSGQAGAIIAGADPGPMGKYTRALGLAFQIADDLLDVTGDADKAGKRLAKDATAGKATFVSLLGESGARDRARALIEEAIAELDTFGAAADPLRQLAQYTVERDR